MIPNLLNKYLGYILIASIFSCILFFQNCSNEKKLSSMAYEISNYSDSAKHYKNKFGKQVAFNKVLEFENKKTLEAYLSSNKELKKAVSAFKKVSSVVVQTSSITIVDSIPFDIEIPCDFEPVKFYRDSSHYKIFGEVSKSNIKFDSIFIPNKQTIIVGNKKTGFLKLGREMRVEVVSSNPLIKTINLSAYTIKKKWYDNPLVPFSIGLLGGLGVNSLIASFSPK